MDEANLLSVGVAVARKTAAGKLIFRRWVGAWIDFLALGALFFLPPLLIAGPSLEPLPAGTPLIGPALMLLYFPITEGVWGRTVGKLITGTIVVNAEGNPPGIGKASIRTFLRLIEVNPFLIGGLPAGLIVFITEAHQRTGDLVAQTYVVPIKELKAASTSPDICG